MLQVASAGAPGVYNLVPAQPTIASGSDVSGSASGLGASVAVSASGRMAAHSSY